MSSGSKHQLVARAPILAFEPMSEGRIDICLGPKAIAVQPFPRRAHQGWRYLEAGDAPPDLVDGLAGGDPLPPDLASELANLSLI